MKFLFIQFSLIVMFFSSQSFASNSEYPVLISDDSDYASQGANVLSRVSSTDSEEPGSRKRSANSSYENMNVGNVYSDVFLEYPKLVIEQIKSMQAQGDSENYKGINYFYSEPPCVEDEESVGSREASVESCEASVRYHRF